MVDREVAQLTQDPDCVVDREVSQLAQHPDCVVDREVSQLTQDPDCVVDREVSQLTQHPSPLTPSITPACSRNLCLSMRPGCQKDGLLLLWEHECEWVYGRRMVNEIDLNRYRQAFLTAVRKEFTSEEQVSVAQPTRLLWPVPQAICLLHLRFIVLIH